MRLIHEAVFVTGLIEEIENYMIQWKNTMRSTYPAVIS